MRSQVKRTLWVAFVTYSTIATTVGLIYTRFL